MAQDLLTWVEAVPNVVVYLLLGAGAAVENVIPAVPADTFVVLGGFLAALGDLEAAWVFASTWACNVSSALVMYRLGHTHGRPFFEGRWGRRLLNAHQMERMVVFFGRWGTLAVLVARFLPGIRSVVPVFAGVTHQRFLPVALPIALASAVWYGVLVWIGGLAGRNLDVVLAALERVNLWLLALAALVGGLITAWWWRTRHHD